MNDFEFQLDAATAVCFIPEVWQGHKDHGAGFWHAFDYFGH